MSRNFRLLGIIGVLFACTNTQHNESRSDFLSPEAVPVISSQDSVWDLPYLFENPNWNAPLEEVRIYDQVSKSEKSFQGYKLLDLIETLIDTSLWSPDECVLVFECKDGYMPSLPLRLAFLREGWVAVREMGLPTGQNWAPDQEATFAPYYLIWEDTPSKGHVYPWPYGLKTLKVRKQALAYASSLPEEVPHLMEGFHLYKTSCMKCHSINKVGGNMGPELNYPKNITTYWQKEDIWEFIKAPYTYRYNAKMPPMNTLSREDFEKIYAYLKHMASRKP